MPFSFWQVPGFSAFYFFFRLMKTTTTKGISMTATLPAAEAAFCLAPIEQPPPPPLVGTASTAGVVADAALDISGDSPMLLNALTR